MKTKIVKVVKPVVSMEGNWLAYDEKREHEEWFEPDGWMRDAMGGRLICYFRAVWSIDEGWQFRQRLRTNYLW